MLLFQSIGLDFLNSSIASAILLFLSFWPGYLLLNRRLAKLDLPFGSQIPIYLGIGLLTLTAFSVVVGTFVIDPYILLILPAASVVGLVVLCRRKNSLDQVNSSDVEISVKAKKSRPVLGIVSNIVPIVLLVFSFLYWNITAAYMKWPQPGDVIAHGYYTSLIIFDGHNPTNLLPISNVTAYYPFGMHVLAANFSELTGMVPGEVFLNLGALILILIPAVAYSLALSYMRSQVFSIILFFSTFYINPKWDLSSFIPGYLYNGPYPNLFAYLICFLILLITVLYDGRRFEWVLALIISESVLALVYPNFFIIIGVVCAIPLLVTFIRSARSGQRPWTGKQTLVIVVTLGILVAIVGKVDFVILQFFTGYLNQNGSLSTAYAATQYPLRDVVTLFVVLAGSGAAIYSLVRRFSGLIYISMVELICNATIFYATNHNWSLITTLEPERLLPLIFVISIFLILATISKTLFSLDERYRIKNFYAGKFPRFLRKIKPIRTVTLVGIAILFIIVILPTMIQTLNFTDAINDSAFTSSQYFQADYNASLWICNNIRPGGLILNEFSWTGYYLPSFCFQRVVFNYFPPHPQGYDLARMVWYEPENQSEVKSILTQLNVSYVYVTSLPQFFDSLDYGGTGQIDWTGATMKYNSSQIIQLFDQYSFLTKLYQYNSSAVYEVNPA